MNRSPIVGQFHSIGALDRLEFIRVNPFTVKYRYVPEILQGEPPTVFEFEHNRENVNVWDDVKAKARAWKEAVRPLSLTAALVPILLGGALALSQSDQFNMLTFLLTLFGAIMIQAGRI
ncbi:hypothetical protein [Paenibacillus macquariensis]|uniref:Uncharacterized protein n=1 Tax=Paenibacillus macquariensis TaxID=948756 RepID=A0ABY1JMT6_9BACL|nr:hypothetical protein [Paenibacillus macquariensis]MEC0092252.1 hypothetical protein [Paenibacillus macquariensis]OAB37202.1 hypothetical protein PMSM_03745 [Paenibacillus macquariensis subsp. macquariensis]SIQ47810.1 hypothetical protein SAMN05421578_102172 [Paenibacillus macquariensis]